MTFAARSRVKPLYIQSLSIRFSRSAYTNHISSHISKYPSCIRSAASRTYRSHPAISFSSIDERMAFFTFGWVIELRIFSFSSSLKTTCPSFCLSMTPSSMRMSCPNALTMSLYDICPGFIKQWARTSASMTNAP